MKWIKIKDKIPPSGKNVILFDGKHVFCGYWTYDMEENICWGNEDGWYENDATHWMELPKPPEDDGLDKC